MPKSINNYGKSSKMVTRSAPKATLAASLFQVSKKEAPSLRNGCHFGATWAILGVIIGIWDAFINRVWATPILYSFGPPFYTVSVSILAL